ncbi:uncharacterized protein PHALS_06137 [Plasmopara halstedii]|uniref:Uncharacterized protein n=1 Tax=Plasmopara halstedii TaxID=4781 RepID=A0A0P1B427_PLAHL|nr:uncharacterized protein PHALS_06137 [Plasmopara halstedii]CEG48308.1 hypothetical protein PHALS_06137 [Plasmopara halstedii]|eukprot:XP_024584677.1 hypothetical protein PHALS_06137 [Plasmopara halstedii]
MLVIYFVEIDWPSTGNGDVDSRNVRFVDQDYYLSITQITPIKPVNKFLLTGCQHLSKAHNLAKAFPRERSITNLILIL